MKLEKGGYYKLIRRARCWNIARGTHFIHCVEDMGNYYIVNNFVYDEEHKEFLHREKHVKRIPKEEYETEKLLAIL